MLEKFLGFTQVLLYLISFFLIVIVMFKTMYRRPSNDGGLRKKWVRYKNIVLNNSGVLTWRWHNGGASDTPAALIYSYIAYHINTIKIYEIYFIKYKI